MRLILDLFEAQVARAPEAIAVAAAGRALSYRELDLRAGQLARALRERDVGPEEVVAFSLDPSVELPVALLGILRAGAAFLALDPAYPEDRLRWMLADCGARVLVLHPHHRERYAGLEVRPLELPEGWEALGALPPWPREPLPPDQLAYLVYTSGSTGTPKAVLASHGGLAEVIEFTRDSLPILPGERVMNVVPTSFDPSLLWLFGSLIGGGTLVLPRREDARPGPVLQETLRRERIHHTGMAPPLLAETPSDGLPELKTVLTGAEVCPQDVQARWASGRRFLCGYGPSEATIQASFIASQDRPLPPASIGFPLPGRRLYLLDEAREPVADGEPGELFLGGTGLARGYLGRPDLTADRFLPDPFAEAPGARMYRTGDRARRLPDGSYEFLGRVDHQVKIRGIRVELEEVERRLREHPRVGRAAAAVRADRAGHRRLTAYVVPSGEISPRALREFLETRLPDHMVPSAWMLLESLPLSPGGKLDRARLPAPDGTRPELEAPFLAPRDGTEAALAEIWREVLGLDRVGVLDPFFDLGGDSLLCLQVCSAAARRGLTVTPQDLFERQTIAQLAPHLGPGAPARASKAEGAAPHPLDEEERRSLPVDPADVEDCYPLSPTQQGLLYHSLEAPEDALYSAVAAFEVRGAIDEEAFASAWRRLAARHPVLRSSVHWEGLSQVVQVVHRSAEPALSRQDLRGLAPAAQREVVDAAVENERRRPPELTRPPPIRISTHRLAEDRLHVCFAVHHLTMDGWSFWLMLDELKALYAGALEGAPPPAEEGPPFRAFIDHLSTQDLRPAEAHWKKVLSGFPGATPAPALPPGEWGLETLALTGPETQALNAAAVALSVTPSVLVSAAWSAVLAGGAREDVVFGMVVSGRMAPVERIDQMLGTFFTTLPLRARWAADEPAAAVVRRLQEQQLALLRFEHTPLPRLRRWMDLPFGTPLYETIVDFQHAPPARPEPARFRIESTRSRMRVGYPLWLSALPGRTMAFELAYEGTSPQGARAVLGRLREALRSLATDPREPMGALSRRARP